MNHLSKWEQKEFIHFAERENGRIKTNEKKKKVGDSEKNEGSEVSYS